MANHTGLIMLSQPPHVRIVYRLLACLWVCCVSVSGQGNRPSTATVLGSSSSFAQLQALYRNSRQWNQAYKASPKSACSTASSKGSSGRANLCAGSANSKEALAQYNQLLLATSPRAYSSSDTQQTGGLQLVSPPGSQDPCQTCTAFAVAGAAEAAMATALGADASQCSISVQALYFCATPISRSCDSGWTLPAALEELQRRGSSLPTAACQPYAPDFRQTDSLCTGSCSMTSPFAQQGSFSFVQISSALAAQNHIRQHGAVLTRFDIYPGFEAFFRNASNIKAVYRPPPGASPQENHAVLLVGYDNDRQLWLARNSWGVDWGDGGLFRVAFDTCAVLTPGSEAYGVVWRPKAVPDAVKLPVTSAGPLQPGCYWYKARPGDYLSRVARLAGVPLEPFMLDNTAVVKDLDVPITGLQLLLCKPQPGKIRVVSAQPAAPLSADGPLALPARPPPPPQPAAATDPPPPQSSVLDAKKPVDKQLQSLLKIKAAIDTTGVLKEWNEENGANGGYCKGWRGVGCTSGTKVVERIDLWSGTSVSGLQGVLPPASAFDGLPRLRLLGIGNQPGIQGTLLSDWSRLQQLQDIQLGNNSLTGTLPPAWSQMQALKILYLHNNALQGPLPDAWSNMAALEDLGLHVNALTGLLPSSWGQLRRLREFWAHDNKLRGPLPDSFKALISLEDLRLSFNSLSSTLPPSWSQMRALRILYLSSNNLQGLLPVAWSGMQRLEDLDLGSNSLDDTMPPAWSQMRALQFLYLNDNKLRGPLPDSFKALISLKHLQLSFNSLSSTLPPAWSQMRALKILYLHNNALQGPLPDAWSNMAALEDLALANNALTESLPSSWGQLRRLREFWAHNNTLRGPLPDSYKALTFLEDLRLSFNSLSSTLPPSWSQMRALRILYLENNTLQGPLPDSYKALTALEQLSLEANGFSGVVPASWQSMTRLTYVSLMGNAKLGGCLPRSWKQQLSGFDWQLQVHDGTSIPGFC